jgi:hypothetical protein
MLPSNHLSQKKLSQQLETIESYEQTMDKSIGCLELLRMVMHAQNRGGMGHWQ